MRRYKKMIVHGSKGHTDDATCAAIAKILNPDIIIERHNEITEEMKNDPEIIICDIGHGKYDHHQEDAKVHEDGEKYAACTLLFEDFKDQLFKTETGKIIFESFLRIIEHTDNTGEMNPLSGALNKLSPCWNEKSFSNDDAFFTMVDKLKAMIEAQIEVENNLLFNAFAKDDCSKEDDELVYKIQKFFEYSTTMLGVDLLKTIIPEDLDYYTQYTCSYDELIEDFDMANVPFFKHYIYDKYDLMYEAFQDEYRNEIRMKNDITNAPYAISYSLCALLYKGMDPALLLKAIKTNNQELITENETFKKNKEYLMKQFSIIQERDAKILSSRDEADRLLEEELIPNAKNFILELEFGLPWKVAARNSNILFAISPDERSDGYTLQTASLYRNIPLIPIPQDIECNYIHHSGHMAIFNTKEEALACANKLIEENVKNKTFIETLDIFCDFNSDNLYANFGDILRGIKLYMDVKDLSFENMVSDVINCIDNFENEDFVKALIHTISIMSELGIETTKDDLISEYKEFYVTNTTILLPSGDGYVFELERIYDPETYSTHNKSSFQKYNEKDFEKYKQNLKKQLEYERENQDYWK